MKKIIPAASFFGGLRDQITARAQGDPKQATIQPRFRKKHLLYDELAWHLLPARTKDRIKREETANRRQHEKSLLQKAIRDGKDIQRQVRLAHSTFRALCDVQLERPGIFSLHSTVVPTSLPDPSDGQV